MKLDPRGDTNVSAFLTSFRGRVGAAEGEEKEQQHEGTATPQQHPPTASFHPLPFLCPHMHLCCTPWGNTPGSVISGASLCAKRWTQLFPLPLEEDKIQRGSRRATSNQPNSLLSRASAVLPQ